MRKKITIVTSAYRCELYLLGFLENMLQLTNKEEISVILVINDPTSYEQELSSSFHRRFPDFFHVYYPKRETIGASINRGLCAACTPYVAYADVDDRRPPDAFERQLATLENHPEVFFTYGDFLVVKKPDDRSGRHVKTPEFDSVEFTRSSCVGPGHFFRKSLLDQVGYFDEQLRSGADFDFQIRAAFQGQFRKTPGIVAYYLRDHCLPSASKTPWQKIECSVIYLRYGIYDKIDYDYVPFITLYHISEVFYEGKWTSLQKLVPHYEEVLRSRNVQWGQLGIKNYLRQKRFFGKVEGVIKRAVCKIKEEGMKEAIQALCRHLQTVVIFTQKGG